MVALKIAAFAGSLRKDSLNKQILKHVVNKLHDLKIELTLLDIAKYDFPLFNQDFETDFGMPEKVVQFKDVITNSNAIIVASPEYNSSVSGVLKNVIDWVSRKADEKETTYYSFAKKPVGLISASPGNLGGLRGLNHLRDIMLSLGCYVMPEMVAIPQAMEITEDKIKKLENFTNSFVAFAQKLAS